jgi:hypothetical protein
MRFALLLVAGLFVIHAGWAQTPDVHDSTTPSRRANSLARAPTDAPAASADAATTPTRNPSSTRPTKPVRISPLGEESLEIYLTLTFWVVFAGSALATFVASIMADEQEQRLKNGTFGAVAGTSVGALAALITNDRLLVISGFCGSGFGALLGWIGSLVLSFWAAKTAIGKTVLTYQISGFKGVKEQLDLVENEPLMRALEEWGRSFTRRVDRQRDDVLRLAAGGSTNQFISILLRGWVYSTVDVLGLLFKLAKKPGYQNRITLIIFGVGDGDKPLGKHWISDSGALAAHNSEQEFDATSIGYKVVTQEYFSPYFFTSGAAAGSANNGQNRGTSKYRPFWTFRINDSAVLSIDWPGDLGEHDPFLTITRDLFHLDVGPKIEATLGHWFEPRKLYEVVGLKGPLPPVKPSPAAPPAAAVGAGAATASSEGNQVSGKT